MSTLKRFALLLALTATWSPSFLFIKLAVAEMGPFTIAGLRAALGAILLFGLIRARGQRLPMNLTFWRHSAVIALTIAFPFTALAFAEQSIDSGLAALLGGTSPLFTALIAHRFLANESLTTSKVIGIILGLVGLSILCVPTISTHPKAEMWGVLAASLTPVAYAISHVYAKRFATTGSPMVTVAAQLMASAIILLPIAAILEEPWQGPVPSITAWFGLLNLTIICTVAAHVLYFYLLKEMGPTSISMVGCCYPMGGLLLGTVFLNEPLTLPHLLAGICILTGMLIVADLIQLPARTLKRV